MTITNEQIELAIPTSNTGTVVDTPKRVLTQQLLKDLRDSAAKAGIQPWTPEVTQLQGMDLPNELNMGGSQIAQLQDSSVIVTPAIVEEDADDAYATGGRYSDSIPIDSGKALYFNFSGTTLSPVTVAYLMYIGFARGDFDPALDILPEVFISTYGYYNAAEGALVIRTLGAHGIASEEDADLTEFEDGLIIPMSDGDELCIHYRAPSGDFGAVSLYISSNPSVPVATHEFTRPHPVVDRIVVGPYTSWEKTSLNGSDYIGAVTVNNEPSVIHNGLQPYVVGVGRRTVEDSSFPANAAGSFLQVVDMGDPAYWDRTGKYLSEGDILTIGLDGNPIETIEGTTLKGVWEPTIASGEGVTPPATMNTFLSLMNESVADPSNYTLDLVAYTLEGRNDAILAGASDISSLVGTGKYVVFNKYIASETPAGWDRSIVYAPAFLDTSISIDIIEDLRYIIEYSNTYGSSGVLSYYYTPEGSYYGTEVIVADGWNPLEDYVAWVLGEDGRTISAYTNWDLENPFLEFQLSGQAITAGVVVYSFASEDSSSNPPIIGGTLDLTTPADASVLGATNLFGGVARAIQEDFSPEFAMNGYRVSLQSPAVLPSLNQSLKNKDIILFDENARPLKIIPFGVSESGGGGGGEQDLSNYIRKDEDVTSSKKWFFDSNVIDPMFTLPRTFRLAGTINSDDYSTLPPEAFNHDPILAASTFSSHYRTGSDLYGGIKWAMGDLSLGSIFVPSLQSFFFDGPRDYLGRITEDVHVVLVEARTAKGGSSSESQEIFAGIRYDMRTHPSWSDYGYHTMSFGISDSQSTGSAIIGPVLKVRTDMSNKPSQWIFSGIQEILADYTYIPQYSNSLVTKSFAESLLAGPSAPEVVQIGSLVGVYTFNAEVNKVYAVDVRLGTYEYFGNIALPYSAVPGDFVEIYDVRGDLTPSKSIRIQGNGRPIRRDYSEHILDTPWAHCTLTYVDNTIGWIIK